MQSFKWCVDWKSYLVGVGLGVPVGCAFALEGVSTSDVHHINFSALLFILLLAGWFPGIMMDYVAQAPHVHQNISRGRMLLWCCGASYIGMASV